MENQTDDTTQAGPNPEIDAEEATIVSEGTGGAETLTQDAAELTDSAAPPIEIEPAPDSLEVQLAHLRAQLQTAEDEKKTNWEKYLRAAADMENMRRRNRRDVDDAKVDAQTRVLKEMLPVVDNLERALEHAEKATGEPQAILEGVRLVLRQFTQAFERIDVTLVEAVGAAFDPNLHEAISQLETSEQEAGTVVAVLQKGYRIGERLLRPAMVVVAKPPSAPASSEESAS